MMKKILISLFVVLLSYNFSFGFNSSVKKSTEFSNVELALSSPASGYVSRLMSVKNSELELSNLSFIANNEGYIRIFSELSVNDMVQIWGDFIYFVKIAKVKKINIFINSIGGDPFAGFALADEIIKYQKQGIIINAYGNGIIASAAVPILVVCKKRIASPGTFFMVHQPRFSNVGDRDRIAVQSDNQLMNLLQDKYFNYLVKYTKLSRKAWEEKELKTTWFTVDDALNWGLIDKVE